VSDLGWIVVNNWERFQHLDVTRSGSGSPVWIKNYTRLMNDDDYLALSPNRVAILHRLWLEYASSSARVRADTRWLSRRLFLRVTTKDLEALNHAGFISFSTRKPHVGDVSDTRPRVYAEEERRKEKTSAEQRRIKTSGEHDTTPGPETEDLESDTNHKPQERELFTPADDWGLTPLPVAATVEELTERWSSE
jgi:hypothetical protein